MNINLCQNLVNHEKIIFQSFSYYIDILRFKMHEKDLEEIYNSYIDFQNDFKEILNKKQKTSDFLSDEIFETFKDVSYKIQDFYKIVLEKKEKYKEDYLIIHTCERLIAKTQKFNNLNQFVIQILKQADESSDDEVNKSVLSAKILLIDPNNFSNDFISMHLTHYGHNILQAFSDIEAKNYLKTEKFDLILLDSSFLINDDYKLFDLAMNKENNALKQSVIILSHHYNQDLRSEVLERGAEDCLSKEQILELKIKIHNILEKNRYVKTQEKNYYNIAKKYKEFEQEKNQSEEFIQNRLSKMMNNKDLSTHWVFQPFHQLGGDFLKTEYLDKENIMIYVLDASGHNTRSSLLASTGSYLLSTKSPLKEQLKSPKKTLNILNEMFEDENNVDCFLTAWYGVYNTTTKILSYSCAGSPPAVLMRENNSIPLELGKDTPVLGLSKYTEFQEYKIELQAKDHIYIFSDGVYEITTEDNTILTYDDLIKDLIKCEISQFNGKELLDKAKSIGSQALTDDYTLLELIIN